MKTRIRTFLIVSVAFIFAASFITPSTAQKRLGVFSHNTRAHKDGKYQTCAACHNMPTKNWSSARRDKQASYPDVATFPSHTSCFGCHTRDIYSNGGAFCGTCHVVPTMRARAVLPFPIKSHPLQFTTRFPHDVHQNLIASSDRRNDVAVGHFVLTSFSMPTPDNKPEFYNCAICHKSLSQMPKFTARKVSREQPLADAAVDIFTPTAKAAPEFFKGAPDSHASCFTCHYQNVKPAAADCAGCHTLTAPYSQTNVVPRYSLKFNHQSTNHASGDCTTCHVRIVQNSDVSKMRDADVPFQTCVKCHSTEIDGEFKQRDASVAARQPAFQCNYCHTSAIGRYEIPASHRSH